MQNTSTKELADLQDKYLIDILDALNSSEKAGSLEIPLYALESDEAMLAWVMSL
ncbi:MULTISPECIES: hypothetical protein [unclassified Gilliamella]|uniref:hypothetical protein n=1 Tax=unclassified Gilliamella TaxID=2685620 RepID=UPI00159EE451|nr:hypothetical protein [Gilliamella apicola]